MKWFVACLVLLGLLAGIQDRALGSDPCEVIATLHELEHSGHHHEPGKPCDPSHDQNCPLEHHQQCGCLHSMPMAAEHHVLARIGAFGFSIEPIRPDSELRPEAPFSELDKPPLI